MYKTLYVVVAYTTICDRWELHGPFWTKRKAEAHAKVIRKNGRKAHVETVFPP